MKPPFNIPGRYTFFQDENHGDDANCDANANFKVSWFEEQVDTFISRRVVSNYQVYNYHQDVPKEAPSTNSKQASDPPDDSVLMEKKMLTFPEDEIDKKDLFNEFLEKLFTYSMDKLIAGTSSRNIDLRPCEIVTGLNAMSSSNINVEDCRDRCSKSFFDASEESPEASDEVVPLNALEIFIKNAMDDSLAKFKEEINKAIDHKFESLRTIPQSSTSISSPDESKGHASESVTEDRNSPLGNFDLEQVKDSLSIDMASVFQPSKESECKIFNIIQPEVNNALFGSDCTNFHSESVNIITKSLSSSSVGKNSEKVVSADSSKLMDSDKVENYEVDNLSKVVNETSLVDDKIKAETDKLNDDSSSLLLGDSYKQMVTESDNISENCIAEAIKKSTNPKLITDMTKFMYIIFESFRRLKEEGLKKDTESSSLSDSISKPSELKIVTESITKEYKGEKDQTNEETESNFSKNIDFYDIAKPVAGVPESVQPSALIEGVNLFNVPTSSARDDRPIISILGDLTMCEDNTDSVKQETFDTMGLAKDSGYSVRKFTKNTIGYKPSTSSKVLDNLKEIYMQNLNSIEQKIISSYNEDKYKCHIKKKFSPCESLAGTRLDSTFYCNLRSKTTEKKKPSDMSMRLNNRMRSKKGSSNIISVRHSLIKSRNRSAFKSVSKKREISFDSTVISLLDISLKNRSSWLRKLSSLSTLTSSEEEKNEEKVNLLKRLCLITFTWGKRHKHLAQLMDQHLSNIYNAICLDFVTDDVYKSVLYVSDQLRSGSKKNKNDIMRRWVKICNKPLAKEKKSFNLECLHQIWVQFRTKIWHLARPPPTVSPNFFPALTYPSEENRLIKEQVIQKYAKDILEYISDPKLYKHSASLYSNNSLHF